MLTHPLYDQLRQLKLDGFLKEMSAVFGERSCQVLDIRPEGAAVVNLIP